MMAEDEKVARQCTFKPELVTRKKFVKSQKEAFLDASTVSARNVHIREKHPDARVAPKYETPARDALSSAPGDSTFEEQIDPAARA